MRKKQKESGGQQAEARAAGNPVFGGRVPQNEAAAQEKEGVRGNGVDYNEYDMGPAERLFCCALAMGCLFLVGYVFYPVSYTNMTLPTTPYV